MTSGRAANWEEEVLTQGLSHRARQSGAAYAGPGSGNDGAQISRPPILFTAGVPDVKALPIDDLVEATEQVLREKGAPALQYGGAQGFGGLRDWLAAHWSKIEGGPLTALNFTLTTGSAHALDNIGETFLDSGDVVAVEAPSFPGSIRTIRSLGVEVESVVMDSEGLVVDALAELIARLKRSGRRVKMLYTIPDFHNPTGATLSLERRHRLLDLCEAEDILIVEDSAYSELGFEEDLPPSLYSLAAGRGVIKIGTFSKIIATGLRVGWCQATQPIIDALVATRYDMGTSPLVIRAIARYAEQGGLDKHLGEIRGFYERKRDLMMNELRERCGGLLSWNEPRGGFFLWVKLDESIDPAALGEAARAEGVAYVGGRAFFAELTAAEAPKPGSSIVSLGAAIDRIRLAFSFTDSGEIPEGIRRFSRALDQSRRA